MLESNRRINSVPGFGFNRVALAPSTLQSTDIHAVVATRKHDDNKRTTSHGLNYSCTASDCSVPVPILMPTPHSGTVTNEDMVFLPLPSLRGGHVRLAVRVLTWVEGRTMSDVGSDGE